MNSRHNSTRRLFLILVLVCAFFAGGTETQARVSDKGAHLIVQRAANFGNEIAVDLSIDGKRVAYIQRDHRYDGFVSAGRHTLTVLPMSAVENPPHSESTIFTVNLRLRHPEIVLSHGFLHSDELRARFFLRVP